MTVVTYSCTVRHRRRRGSSSHGASHTTPRHAPKRFTAASRPTRPTLRASNLIIARPRTRRSERRSATPCAVARSSTLGVDVAPARR
ncbi:hypothetical protein EXIGLDRAFT_720119 [Exidia glandulosa HHB12029]|uniref:Uncharacterized protein n=1 Tax=Exidia glandulosa HHB12029 TaxID=1314781 RepID=A0A165GL78_EXIGL|nr:hypothetical protein EXIGLDRAFT_720119 [Exidia glandulosa HHB12029]